MKPAWLLQSLLSLITTLVTSAVQAELIEQDVDLPGCQLHTHHTDATLADYRPLFVMIEGVPLSARVYRKLALGLADNMDAQSILIDFPGIGKSFLKGNRYTWSDHRACIQSYLATLPPHIVISSDLATPVVAPLLHASLPIRGMVISNSVIKPSVTQPPFPMSLFRCCPQLAIVASAVIPNAILRNRIREIGIGREATADNDEISALSKEMDDNGFSGLAKVMSGITLDEAGDVEMQTALNTSLPILYLWGTIDPVLGEQYKYLPELKIGQQLILYPDARHFPMLDHQQEMAADIESWYKKQFPVEINVYK